MAAGDRKIKLLELHISRNNPVTYSASYGLFIQDSLGADVQVSGGTNIGSLGSLAAAGALTLSQINTQILAAIAADPSTPPNGSVS